MTSMATDATPSSQMGVGLDQSRRETAKRKLNSEALALREAKAASREFSFLKPEYQRDESKDSLSTSLQLEGFKERRN